MKRTLIFMLACLAAMTAVTRGQSHRYRDRWVYVSTGLDTDQDLDRVEGIARTASEHGLNGMLLSAAFDAMDLKSSEARARITRLKQTCDGLGVEIITIATSFWGFGSKVTSSIQDTWQIPNTFCHRGLFRKVLDMDQNLS